MKRPITIGLLATLLAVVLSSGPALADDDARDDPTGWLDGLQAAVAADLRAGRPLVAQVHVALCDNSQVTCGGHGLGDGDNLRTNLYWATTEGFRGWFDRRGSGWTRVAVLPGREKGVLQTIVWRRSIPASDSWKKRGVSAAIPFYVVADAWRGPAIDGALEAYIRDLFGTAPPRTLALGDGVTLTTNSGARLVAYTGHNRFMDRPPYDWTTAARAAGQGASPKASLAVACYTANYLADTTSSRERVPLLYTADFLCAGGGAIEGAILAFARGQGYSQIRTSAAEGYAAAGEKQAGRVQSVFINPGDKRWGRRR